MRAIDVHAHPSTERMMGGCLGKYNEAMSKHYKFEVKYETEEEMAQVFIKADVKGILVGWDAESNTGAEALGNDYLADLERGFPNAFVGAFCGVDPWKGEMAVKEIRRCIKELGMMGVKFQQIAQGFFPNDRRFYPIYEECASLGVPIQFHSGFTGMGAGLPGGAGLKLKYTRPIPYLDDVAADFPNLTIIACHAAWPWQDEMIAVLRHKKNVYNELSGWSPKYFSQALKEEIVGPNQDRFLFGTDYPGLSHDQWLGAFEKYVTNDPKIKEKVFLINAAKLFNIKLD
ncbi:MAG: amidohydrolase [Clostridia bacterium]|nr:MAG: amidohydrolase [Clostridia bacterium]